MDASDEDPLKFYHFSAGVLAFSTGAAGTIVTSFLNLMVTNISMGLWWGPAIGACSGVLGVTLRYSTHRPVAIAAACMLSLLASVVLFVALAYQSYFITYVDTLRGCVGSTKMDYYGDNTAFVTTTECYKAYRNNSYDCSCWAASHGCNYFNGQKDCDSLNGSVRELLTASVALQGLCVAFTLMLFLTTSVSIYRIIIKLQLCCLDDGTIHDNDIAFGIDHNNAELIHASVEILPHMGNALVLSSTCDNETDISTIVEGITSPDALSVASPSGEMHTVESDQCATPIESLRATPIINGSVVAASSSSSRQQQQRRQVGIIVNGFRPQQPGQGHFFGSLGGF